LWAYALGRFLSLIPPIARHVLFGPIGTLRFAVESGGFGFRLHAYHRVHAADCPGFSE
jgi:hypothetical protein